MPLVTDRERELFERVLDAPDDLQPRLVLADALLERGELYGVFIQLSCAERLDRDARRRLAALRRSEVPRFLGDLSALLSPNARRRQFADGLLDGCALAVTESERFARAADDPLWGTVRQVTLPKASDRRVYNAIGFTARNRRWRWLDRVSLGAPYHLRFLCTTPAFAVRTLHVEFCWPDDVGRLGDVQLFPELRRLELDMVPMGGPDPQAQLAKIMTRPLELLQISGVSHSARLWITHSAGGAVETLRLVHAGCTLETSPRAGDGRWTLRRVSPDGRKGSARALLRRFDSALVSDVVTVEGVERASRTRRRRR